MMNGFLKKVFGTTEPADKRRDGAAAAPPLPIDRLGDLIRFFPLGEKIRYYPEYQEGGALDTLVLGYGINKEFIYSPLHIRHQQDGGREALRLLVDGQEQLVNEVKRFCILIPYNQADDNKRDYVRRAELGPQGAFRHNNIITLTACTNGGILSTLDTLVRRVQPLESGIYAGHQVVLLDVKPETLKQVDQRQHYRLPTNLPVRLAFKDGGVYLCNLLDFSEQSVQVGFDEPNPELERLNEHRRLTLTIDINEGSNHKQFTLDGAMYRKNGNNLVMTLQGIHQGREVKPLGLVDILDIKASLLRQPETQWALDAARSNERFF